MGIESAQHRADDPGVSTGLPVPKGYRILLRAEGSATLLAPDPVQEFERNVSVPRSPLYRIMLNDAKSYGRRYREIFKEYHPGISHILSFTSSAAKGALAVIKKRK